jgi:hypothetical protein
MAIKYINIFQSNALQNLPKLVFFWFENKPSGNPVPECLDALNVSGIEGGCSERSKLTPFIPLHSKSWREWGVVFKFQSGHGCHGH